MADAKKITTLLLKKYNNPKTALDFSNPLELLVATILSAQCTDVRVNIVTKDLFRKYKTVSDYANARPAVFEDDIRSTGFFRNKSKMIIGCCKRIISDFGGRVPETIEELTTLPGVGRKTANCVVGSAFGQEAIAVDTHVLRVSNRLGLVNSKNPDKIEMQLRDLIPKGRLSRMNHALILHGRETCKARKPACNVCVVNKECEWPDKSLN